MSVRPGILAAGVLTLSTVGAQVNVPVNGPHDKSRPVEAFVHATLHPTPGAEVKDAILLIKGDRILAAGASVEVPAGSIIHDGTGLHIWPALVEPYSDLGLDGADKDDPQADHGAHYWNAAIRSSRRAADLYVPDEEKAAALRAQGFGAVLTHRMDGVARGTGAVVLLAGRTVEEDMILPEASAQFSFRKGSSKDDYPSSLMGAIALLRQTFYDADWYAGQGSHEQSDMDLQALNDQRALPQVFDASDHLDVLRIAALGREFGRAFIVKGRGDEYQRLVEIKATGQPLIVPLQLPEAYDVEDPFEALEVNVAQMKHWELAPHNARMLHESGIPFAFTTQGLKEPADLWASLRRMVLCGLDSAAAIAALTIGPARMLHVDDRCGTLEPGKLASFIITSDHLLAAKNTIHETWVAGQRWVMKTPPDDDLRGTYDLNLRSTILKLRVKGEIAELEAVVYRPDVDSIRVKADLTHQGDLVTLRFAGEKIGMPGSTRLNGIVHRDSGIWDGQGQLPGGEWIVWSAVKQRDAGQERDKEEKKDKEEGEKLDSLWSAPVGEVWYPPGAFGSPIVPDTGTFLFRHATVWTNSVEGILRDVDVCVHEGLIKAVSAALHIEDLFPGRTRPEIIEIDATGRHLTCGIIDEHSHIAIARGVNEGGQAVSAEVRIGDVIDPNAVGIYRDLAGGVTTIQQLHGSANPIGGQSALSKLRWGLTAEQMKIAGASGFIKFALGENVKQSGSANSIRFPRTRMGVEQSMFDAFHRAREYKLAHDRWSAGHLKEYAKLLSKKSPERDKKIREFFASGPRRDLELDALAEVLRGQRFITCHSYVQSEILMLMRLADSLEFRVNTFTHVLEGYKVAEKLREHGASASTFSDWWAYKFEVYDAIPYNAALMHDAGVNVCINSDDAEMSRRLNQEAAKTVKYGGMSEEEAWKTVTLNPAKALHLDGRMGSVEVGKDADLVLWSTNPLNIEARVEMTVVDGVPYFDRGRDMQLREAMRVERERLVQKMLLAKKSGAPTRKGGRRERGQWTCETIGEEP